MTRLDNWQTQLSDYLTHCYTTPFRYGQLDCGLFVAGAIEAMTGVDVATPLRGKYGNRIEAFKAIKALCGHATMEAAAQYFAQEHDVHEIPVLCAQRGDAVVLKKGKVLPLVKPVGGYQTAPSFHRFSVGWACGDGFGLGVDGIEGHPAVLRQERYQTPAHDGQFPLPGVGTEPDDRLERLWRYVVGRGEVGIIEHVRVACLHPLCNPLFIRSSAVSSAHGKQTSA